MKMVANVAVLVIIGLCLERVYGSSVCPHNGQYYGKTKMCYHLEEDEVSWYAARSACQAQGGDLAVVTDASVNWILVKLAEDAGLPNYDIWIGLRVLGDDPNRYFEWVDDTPMLGNYQNWPPGVTPVLNGLICTLLASNMYIIIPEDGQWMTGNCNGNSKFFCQIPYSCKCDDPDAVYCKDYQKCYWLTQTPLTFEDARDACAAVGGEVATVPDIGVNDLLRNLIPDFVTRSAYMSAWIGATTQFAITHVWEWIANGDEVIWNNFPPSHELPINPTPVDGCTVISVGEAWNDWLAEWQVKTCNPVNHIWYFCQAHCPISVCCDPHFVARPQGMNDAVCFDYYGEDGDIIQLVYSKKYDLAVNGKVFAHQHTKKTWFRAISFVMPGCEVVAYVKGIKMNDKLVEWTGVRDQSCGESGVTYSITEDPQRDSTHLVIKVTPGLELIISKDMKTYKFGTVEYMDFDMNEFYKLDESTDGILGQFLGMTVSLDEDSVRNETDTGVLYFPDEPGRGSVTAHRVGRKNLLTNKHFHCWNVEDEGAGLLRGTARDYLVSDLLTSERAQSLHQREEEEEIADATF